MKKLNITKKKFNESKYFQTKYGKLEYVSESGKLYKTTKGKVLKFVNESIDDVTIEEFSKMYGKSAAEALIKYCDANDKTPEEVINGSDREMSRFENWAKKVLHFDIYDKFSGYDYDSDLEDVRSEMDESHNDIDNDPAYECPYCGGHNCEFVDADDYPEEGYFDGSTLGATFNCPDCNKDYLVSFKLSVYDKHSAKVRPLNKN